MNPQHLVVLGGTDFVGSHLLPRLVADGHHVTVLSRNRERRRALAVLPGVRIVSVDVHDPAALRRALEDSDAAINLVGILAPRGTQTFKRVHVDFVRELIAACGDAGVPRLLQMSALNAGRGSSHYLRTRGEAEQLVKDCKLAWTIFQPSVIFGRGDGLFTRFAGLLRLAPVLPLAKANAKFAPVYVGDVAAAFVTALGRKDTVGQTYELYGEKVLSLREIVDYTADLLGLRRVVIPLPDALARIQALVFDFVPGKPFSTDNYRSLQLDSVGGIDGLHRLGIAKTPLESVVPLLHGRGGRQRHLDRCRLVR